MVIRLRPYWMQIGLGLYCFFCLLIDSHLHSLWQQHLLGLVTFAVLYLVLRRLPREERGLVWLCVLVATGAELFGSVLWGLYRYRWHNVPLFVPPGHGMVYVFGITAARTPLMLRHGRPVIRVILGSALAWAVGGLTVLPLVTGRLDILGTLFMIPFIWFLLRSKRAAMFAAIFVATSGLELIGVNFRNWMWMPVAPYVPLIHSGNPPSVVAGGYCVIDGSALIVSQLLWTSRQHLVQAWRWIRPLPAPVPDTAPID